MGKKILFAVMALLVMATGKIWAQDTAEKKAYAVLYQNTENAIGSLHFMYTNEDVTQTNKTTEIKNDGSSDATTTITLTYSKHWEVKLDAGNPDWQDYTNGLTTDEKAKITEVVFMESFKDVKVKSCNRWFYSFTSLAEIKDIKYLDTSEVTYMSYMFNGCEALTSLDLSSFVTSEVTYMDYMFNGCKALTSLDLSNFKTSKVKDMGNMFCDCSSMESLTLSSSFDTSKVENMGNMFCNCSKLKSLDLSSFKTLEATAAYSMFDGCNSLTTLTLGNFDMSKMESTESFNNMFNGCTNLKILDLSKVTAEKYITNIIGELPENSNPVIFIPTRMNITDPSKNIVTEGGTCEEFVIDANNLTSLNIPYDFKAKTVTFTRTFAAGKPHTVCLPFAVNATEYGTFYKLSSYDKDNRRVKFTKVEDATEANKPYLFIPDKNKADVTKIEVKGDVDGVAIYHPTLDEGNGDIWHNGKLIVGFRGVYEKLTFTEEYLEKNPSYDYYGWTAAGDFKKAGAGASVAPYRAYIILTKETTGSGSAPARLSVEFDDGETTGIGTAKSTANGGADEPMYNLQGQRVDSGYKGVVIKNGKKMIVR